MENNTNNLEVVVIPMDKIGYDKGDVTYNKDKKEYAIAPFGGKEGAYGWQAQQVLVIDRGAEIKNCDWILDTRTNKCAQNIGNVIKKFNAAICLIVSAYPKFSGIPLITTSVIQQLVDSGMRAKIERINVVNSCPEFPYFGATYPDACCIDGYLWDLDSDDGSADDEGTMLTSGGETPCPFCNTESFIKADGGKKSDVLEWIEQLRAKYDRHTPTGELCLKVVSEQVEVAKLINEQITPTERILCAALMFNSEVITGHRHNDCYRLLTHVLKVSERNLPDRDAQGFLTSHNRYVDRKEGYIIAKKNNQLLLPPIEGEDDSRQILTSEDLY